MEVWLESEDSEGPVCFAVRLDWNGSSWQEPVGSGCLKVRVWHTLAERPDIAKLKSVLHCIG